MAGNVIDSLVVTLGLDSKGFSKGVKGSAEELAGFTRRLAGMFLAVRGLEDVVGYFKDLHQQLAEVGFQARNLGLTGQEIKRLGEVSQLFGGQVQDATDSIEGLQNAVFNLRYRGQVADSIAMLQRFGVAYLTASGHARNFRDIALDAAKAIERQARAAGLTQGERYQLALSFGFTGGVASAVAQGGKGLEDALRAAQVDQRALTEKTIQGQVQLDRDITRLQNVTEAQSSVILSRLTPVLEQAVSWLQKLVNDLLPKIVHAIEALINFFKNPPPWMKSIEDGIRSLAQALGPTGTLIAALGALTLAVGAGSALITGIAGLAAFLAPLAAAIGGGALLGKLIAGLPSGGLLDKLNEKVLDWIGPGSDLDVKKTPPPKGARVGTITRPPATPTAPRQSSAAQQSAAAGQPPTAMVTGAGTQVHIDDINVYTRATDASGIASGIGSALQRKLLVSNADRGLS